MTGKRTGNRLIALALLGLLLLNLVAVTLPAGAAEATKGLTFAADTKYSLDADKAVTTAPLTFEATISLTETAKNTNGRYGVILGTWNGSKGLNVEINQYGYLRFYLNNGSTTVDKVFEMNLATGNLIHLALTVDLTANKLSLYLDGILRGEISSLPSNFAEVYNSVVSAGIDFAMGGDYRANNANYFSGVLYNVAAYSDIRTAAEIEADSVKMLSSADNIIMMYDMNNLMNVNRIEDLSGNGFDMIRNVQKGLEFLATETYDMVKKLEGNPHTFEVTIKLTAADLTENALKRGGVILGTWGGNTGMNVEVTAYGKPRLYMSNGGPVDMVFDTVTLTTGEKLHLSIVIDESAEEVRCYVDGVLKETKAFPSYFMSVYNNLINGGIQFRMGGDYRTNNTNHFAGQLFNAAIFSDVRTAEEIQADMNGMPQNDTELLAWYDTTENTTLSYIPDASGNGHHVKYSGSIYEGGMGMTFTADALYKPTKDMTETPITFEAVVCFPETMSGRGGVILGNYGRSNCVNFEVYDGHPRLYTSSASIVFDQVNLYTGEPIHVAIVRDAANAKVHCYVNGVLTQSKDCACTETIDLTSIVLGGDMRSGNEQYFKGSLISAAIFSDVRTAEQIQADMTAVPTDSTLIAYYDLNDIRSIQLIDDKSGNGYDMKRETTWFTEKDPVTDYAYSFAVVGDTQIIATKEVNGSIASGSFAKIYDYILANKESKNIQFVMGLGDITDTYEINSISDQEWTLAMTNIHKLDGQIPYSLIRGNHDAISQFDKYVDYSTYKDTISGSYEENMRNTYRELVVGDVQYLIFGLDYGASDAVLAWAGQVIKEHPYHNVIITTHAYLYRDGTTLDQNDVCPPATSGGYNNGDHIWDKLIKKYENIVLVLSGHDPCDDIVVTQTEGVNGNIVTQMLIDPQGIDTTVPTGMVAMLYFSEDGKNVTVEWYSTIQEKYYKQSNQFTVTLDVVEPDYTELNSTIDAAKTKVEADYTAESWAEFAKALADAQLLLESRNQTQINSAVASLKAAMAALEEIPDDTGDATVQPTDAEEDDDTTQPAGTEDDDNTTTSPDTGDSRHLFIVAVAMMAVASAAGMAVVSKKKYS